MEFLSPPKKKKNSFIFGGCGTFFALKITSENVSRSFPNKKRNLDGKKRNFQIRLSAWALIILLFKPNFPLASLFFFFFLSILVLRSI
jgi:predicted CDP-diglyceride synthetase/phosphatidate cytidylyltransferase